MPASRPSLGPSRWGAGGGRLGEGLTVTRKGEIRRAVACHGLTGQMTSGGAEDLLCQRAHLSAVDQRGNPDVDVWAGSQHAIQEEAEFWRLGLVPPGALTIPLHFLLWLQANPERGPHRWCRSRAHQATRVFGVLARARPQVNAGLFIVAAGVCCAAYSIWVYGDRLYRLDNKVAAGYADHFGPYAITSVVVFAFVTSLV